MRDLGEGEALSAWDYKPLGGGADELSWQNAHKKLVWCTERRSTVIDLWIAFSNVIIIVGRLGPESLESLPLGKPSFS